MSANTQRDSQQKRTNVKSTILKLWTGSLLSSLVLMAGGARAEWLNQTTADALGNHLVDGVTGPVFTLTAKEGHISTAEGSSVYIWGLATNSGPTQYPGPTLIVNQGDPVSITLKNTLPFPVSLVFPGQTVTATGGNPGLLTREATNTPTGDVTYTFTASRPGTYAYNSGTRQDLQIEMGMTGALIVRPAGFSPSNKATWKGYNTTDSAFDVPAH